MTRRRSRLPVLALAALLLAGCSADPDLTPTAAAPSSQAPSTPETAPESEPPPEPTPTPTPTPEPSESDSGFGGTEDSAATGPGESAAPQTVPTTLIDTPLGLSRVFSTIGEWEENRYEVADRSDVAGMGVSVETCYDDRYAPQLEFRLANRFSKLRFTVSQSNASVSSDQLLAVVVLGNEEQRDIQKVPFNQVKPIELDITGVNALKVRFYLEDEDGCSSGTEVTAVVEDLRVS